MMIAGPIVASVFTVDALRKGRKTVFTAVPCALLFAYGWLALFGQTLGACGGAPFVRKTSEWPILFAGGAVEDSAGTAFVPHVAAGRIQAYDETGKFLHGWFVDANGGVFHLHITSNDQVDVYTSRGSKHLTFGQDGTLLAEARYPPREYGELPAGPPSDVQLAPPAWYLIPLTGVFPALLVTAAGMIAIAIHSRMLGIGGVRKRGQEGRPVAHVS